MKIILKKIMWALIISVTIIFLSPLLVLVLIYLITKDMWEDIDIGQEIEEELHEKEQRILAAAIKSNTKNRKNRSL